MKEGRGGFREERGEARVHLSLAQRLLRAAFLGGRRGNNFKGFKGLCLKAKARIRP